MSATPAGKLSEPALADGIRLFYQQANMVPVGIGLEAVEALCAKMGFALRKLTQKFKRVYKESQPRWCKAQRCCRREEKAGRSWGESGNCR